MKKETIIREVMSLCDCKYQVAGTIVELAKLPTGTLRKVSLRRAAGEAKPSMTQGHAKAIVDRAVERIQLVDSLD